MAAGMKGVELEVLEGLTEHSSRVALKNVFQNFGDVVACWVPPIDRRHVDHASIRFGAAESAEAAHAACTGGQVFLQGMCVRVGWRSGGGRRVGNSDLGKDAGGNEALNQTYDEARKRRRSRSRRSRGGRRDRSRSRRRRSDRPEKSAITDVPMMPSVADQAQLPAWLREDSAQAPQASAAPGTGFMQPALGNMPAGMAGMPGTRAGALMDGAAPFDPEEDARKRAEIEKRKRERAAQVKRAPGVAELVQVALQRARDQPSQAPKEQPKVEKEVPRASPVHALDAGSDDESEGTAAKRIERETKNEQEAKVRTEQEEKDIEERAKKDKEKALRREQLRKEAEEAEKELEAKMAATRDERIKASVEAAKRQQAQRNAANANTEANNLYGNMPQADLASEQESQAARLKEAEQRQKLNALANLPAEDRGKVVFLDIDGVLRPARAGGFDILGAGDTDASTKVDTSDFFPSAMKALRHIMEKSGAMVVLTSEWRRSDAWLGSLTDVFEKNRLRVWSDKTPTSLTLETGSDPLKSFADRRAREIAQWLEEHEGKVKGWVVLDDINIAMADEKKTVKAAQGLVFGQRLVQTWPLCGLTMGNAKTAARILNGEMINKVVVERVAPKSAPK